MKKRRYKRCRAGRWEQPIPRGYLMACCDCCLVHRMDFRVVNGRAQFRAWRAGRLTEDLRKRSNIEVERTKRQSKRAG